jgi:hypothetical protein
MVEKVTPLLTNKFLEFLNMNDLMSGNNLLTFEVAKQYIQNFLELEVKNIVGAQTNKIDYRVLSQEENISWILPITIEGEDIEVKISGFADRIEQLGNQVQLVDYKTGNVVNTDLSFTNWDDLMVKPEKSKALQLAIYGYIYLMQNPHIDDFVAGIYSFRNLKSGLLQLKFNRKPVSANDLRVNMPQVIEGIVHAMLDPTCAITHNKNAKYCNYC